MAVPKTSSHNQTRAVNYGRIPWDFDRGIRSNGHNMAIVYED